MPGYCPQLNLANGRVECSLKEDGKINLGDTCHHKCNYGYILTDNVTRACQSDRSWSGNEPTCEKGTDSINIKNYNKLSCTL